MLFFILRIAVALSIFLVLKHIEILVFLELFYWLSFVSHSDFAVLVVF